MTAENKTCYLWTSQDEKYFSRNGFSRLQCFLRREEKTLFCFDHLFFYCSDAFSSAVNLTLINLMQVNFILEVLLWWAGSWNLYEDHWYIWHGFLQLKACQPLTSWWISVAGFGDWSEEKMIWKRKLIGWKLVIKLDWIWQEILVTVYASRCLVFRGFCFNWFALFCFPWACFEWPALSLLSPPISIQVLLGLLYHSMASHVRWHTVFKGMAMIWSFQSQVGRAVVQGSPWGSW